jgi:hypothetical protein
MLVCRGQWSCSFNVQRAPKTLPVLAEDDRVGEGSTAIHGGFVSRTSERAWFQAGWISFLIGWCAVEDAWFVPKYGRAGGYRRRLRQVGVVSSIETTDHSLDGSCEVAHSCSKALTRALVLAAALQHGATALKPLD